MIIISCVGCSPFQHSLRRPLGASQVALVVKNPAANAGDIPWVRKIPWRRAWHPTAVFLPGDSPWTEEPGGLQSMGWQRVGHDRSDLAAEQLWGFPGGSVSREYASNVGDLGFILGSGRFPGEGTGNPLQYCCLGKPMEREA